VPRRIHTLTQNKKAANFGGCSNLGLNLVLPDEHTAV